ncbi:NAD(P)H-binding protein [Streptomyces gilvosporeus]|uniref:NmrA family transcriptional regulator n=1 Tax=Streptomyces gilvosporeus TaxID=553510 RepID=A0A1V0TV99_9ACTN|nr:NAD(P)H-binding protein [Streptomyces gilvosporeus]ARF56813.1 NmrA family transcriptional regulator [Streptomyces gilvosporeus]
MESLLVLGGTGKTGSRIARRLKTAGLPVRTASRTGGDLPFDLDDPASWPPALDGATAAYLVEPSLSASTDHRARIPRLVAEAVTAGVRRLVLLSAPRAGEDGHPLHAAERAVRDSGVDWTILRPQWFAQNFSEGPWRPGILAGTLALPTGDGRTPFVDAEDIAEVAVAALTEDRHSGRVYDLTGPRAIGFGEAADLISRATGRTIRHIDVDPEDFVQRQIAAGAAPDVARLLTGLLTALRNGSGAALSDDVARALRRPPRSFETFVTETAAAGHWN